MSLLELKNLTKIYGEKETAVYGLRGVDFTVGQQDSIAVMGTSGSGKSTLLNILGLIDAPTDGQYFINGNAAFGCSKQERARLRNRFFGFVMQDFALIPHYCVERNVQIPLDYTGCPRKEKKERIMEVLKKLHIEDKCRAYPSQLSGGQRQRVAIARAIINDAKVLLCDEPTGALDSRTSAEIMDIFQALNEAGKTLVIVTHDADVAKHCKRLVRIEDGRLSHIG